MIKGASLNLAAVPDSPHAAELLRAQQDRRFNTLPRGRPEEVARRCLGQTGSTRSIRAPWSDGGARCSLADAAARWVRWCLSIDTCCRRHRRAPDSRRENGRTSVSDRQWLARDRRATRSGDCGMCSLETLTLHRVRLRQAASRAIPGGPRAPLASARGSLHIAAIRYRRSERCSQQERRLSGLPTAPPTVAHRTLAGPARCRYRANSDNS